MDGKTDGRYEHASRTRSFRRKSNYTLGAYLSPEDMMGLQKLMTDVVAKGVVAEMERRMFTINQEVNASRKGLKNTFKSWWRKPKESSEDAMRRIPSMITSQ